MNISINGEAGVNWASRTKSWLFFFLKTKNNNIGFHFWLPIQMDYFWIFATAPPKVKRKIHRMVWRSEAARREIKWPGFHLKYFGLIFFILRHIISSNLKHTWQMECNELEQYKLFTIAFFLFGKGN